MNDENEIESVAEDSAPQSEESKFFGIKTQIMPRAGDSDPDSEINVEVIDPRKPEDRKPKKSESVKDADNESEVENYSARVKKRIDKLKYDYHEERRQREEAARLRDEAITYAQRIQEENKRLSALVSDSQKAIQQQIVERAKAAASLAESDLRRAHEAGDADAIVKAQQSLTRAQLTEAAAPTYASQIAAKLREAKAEQAPAQNVLQQAAQSVPRPDPKAARWQSENQWFGKDPEMTSFAYGVHQKLISENGDNYASTDEYYAAINKRMRQVFPDRFSEDDESDDFYAEEAEVETRTATPKKASKRMPVVAPATRNTGSAPRKVQLTATQVALAKRLGLTPQQYAMQVMKEMKNG